MCTFIQLEIGMLSQNRSFQCFANPIDVKIEHRFNELSPLFFSVQFCFFPFLQFSERYFFVTLIIPIRERKITQIFSKNQNQNPIRKCFLKITGKQQEECKTRKYSKRNQKKLYSKCTKKPEEEKIAEKQNCKNRKVPRHSHFRIIRKDSTHLVTILS